MQGSDDFSGLLLPGERVVWSGGPAQGVRFTAADLLLVPFSLIWLGFAIFWESSVVSIGRAPLFMKLWGAPFILFGLYFVFGRLLVDAWARGRISYALTTKRVLIQRCAPFGRFTALPLDRLGDMSLSEGRNGRGTIRFGPAAPFWQRSRGMGAWSPALDAAPQFLAVEDARNLFDRIQRAVGKAA